MRDFSRFVESPVTRHLISLSAAAVLLCAFTSANAQTTEVAGVKYENNQQLANTPLVLNGAGIRYKAIFKVYTAGLYLPKKPPPPRPCWPPPARSAFTS